MYRFLFVALFLAAVVEALVPALPSTSNVRLSSSSSSLAASAKFDVKKESGISGPFGFFDPFDICPKDAVNFKKVKESELKHGRVAMLAFVGIVAGELFPFVLGDKITGPAIFQYQQAEGIIAAWSANVIGLTLAVEGFAIIKTYESPTVSEGVPNGIKADGTRAGLKLDYLNGDLGFDPLGFKGKASIDMRTKEINNGRLAMLGVAGIVAQELVTGAKVF